MALRMKNIMSLFNYLRYVQNKDTVLSLWSCTLALSPPTDWLAVFSHVLLLRNNWKMNFVYTSKPAAAAVGFREKKKIFI